MACLLITGINNITVMYEEVEAEEVRPVFGMLLPSVNLIVELEGSP